MQPLAVECIERAEIDWETVSTLYHTRNQRLSPVICFHAQQTAEKYRKGWLCENNVDPPRSHHLAPLVRLLPNEAPLWTPLFESLDRLSRFAIVGRYIGEEVDWEDVKLTRRIASEVRSLIRERLGLD